MIIKDYKKDEVNEMTNLPSIKNMFFNEGELYLTKNNTVIKRIRNTYGDYFGNKLYTIHSLINSQDKINIEELVYPSNLISVDDVVVGYEMPFIEGITLDEYLKSPKIELESKLDALKKVGMILRKMKDVRENKNIEDFFLNDLHEKNFIVTPSTNIKVVDLDSCSISSNLKFGTKYVSSMTPIKNFSKYKPVTKGNCGAEFIPSEETDLYCYIIMLLNFLSGTRMHIVSIEGFNVYLNYLATIGFNKELLDAISHIYSDIPNTNIDYLLDSINKTTCDKARVRTR